MYYLEVYKANKNMEIYCYIIVKLLLLYYSFIYFAVPLEAENKDVAIFFDFPPPNLI